MSLETRTRALNPKWYEALLKHGYEGVREIDATVTNTLGWSATTGEVQPWVYQQLAETYVLDDAMRDRLAALNPKASAKIANRLIEAHRPQLLVAGRRHARAPCAAPARTSKTASKASKWRWLHDRRADLPTRCAASPRRRRRQRPGRSSTRR